MIEPNAATYESRLAGDIGGFAHDPLGFVLYAFPWGEGALAGRLPEPWQRGELEGIGEALQAGATLTEATVRAVRRAVASGHGIGKSALVAWIILWAMATAPDARGVVTANTEHQLKGKTWAELAKWHRLCLCGHWFECTATALISRMAGHEKTWRCDMVPWTERNTEAFAGLHNQGRRVFLVFDEASAIPDPIWEVSEGALTDDDTEILWVAFGNPTRNTGRFRECFGRFRHRWATRQVDSREVSITNKAQIRQWVDDYGEDSDFVRVRVKGIFPNMGDMQFIATTLAEEAAQREVMTVKDEPLVMGLDVARFGDDQSVICFRRGRDARSIPWKKYRGLEAPQLVARVIEAVNEYRPAAVFVDGGGVGGPVVDYLRRDHRVPGLVEVNFAGKADKKLDHGGDYANKRAEMWDSMRGWLQGGAIPRDQGLIDGLTGLEYGFDGQDRLILEKKADMKKRGLASPDEGDALALTFAQPVLTAARRLERPKFAEMD